MHYKEKKKLTIKQEVGFLRVVEIITKVTRTTPLKSAVRDRLHETTGKKIWFSARKTYLQVFSSISIQD